MTTQEITLSAEYTPRVETLSEKTFTVPATILKAIAKGKKVLSYLRRHVFAIAALAGCIALNLHWGVNGTLFLALPYAIIWDHLDNDR